MEIDWNLRLKPIEVKGLRLLGLLGLLWVGLGIVWMMDRDWFWQYAEFLTHVEDANGLAVGSPVTYKGVPIGHVVGWHLDDQFRVAVRLKLKKNILPHLKQGSYFKVVRSHWFSNRQFELIIPNLQAEVLKGQFIPTRWQVDVMAWLTGRLATDDLELWTQAFSNLGYFLLQVTDQKRLERALGTLDHLSPVLVQLSDFLNQARVLLKDLNREKKLAQLVGESYYLLNELKGWLNQLQKAGGVDPAVYAQIVRSLDEILRVWHESAPRLNESISQLPEVLDQTLTTFREVQILSQALQDTFWLRSSSEKSRRLWLMEKSHRRPACEKEPLLPKNQPQSEK